jgi:hypothetical protein
MITERAESRTNPYHDLNLCAHRRGALVRHPALLINAFNNTVYWVALAFVLREPLGVVLVVLAFLLAGFLVAPFETVVGISGDPGADWLVSTNEQLRGWPADWRTWASCG